MPFLARMDDVPVNPNPVPIYPTDGVDWDDKRSLENAFFLQLQIVGKYYLFISCTEEDSLQCSNITYWK